LLGISEKNSWFSRTIIWSVKHLMLNYKKCIGGIYMKKLLKQNKGFSLVELLVAILIMAVIAGTAIMLFGGVISSSKERADQETAENIKRAILTYMNLTNDTDLSCLDESDSKELIKKLSCVIKIDADTGVSFNVPDNAIFSEGPESVDKDKIDGTDMKGKYGPFLDASKDMSPQTPGKVGWKIKIDEATQVIKVESQKDEGDCTVDISSSTDEDDGEGG